MSEIEIRFGAVLGDEHLSVLIRAHRSGIDIYIGVEFLRGYLESARF